MVGALHEHNQIVDVPKPSTLLRFLLVSPFPRQLHLHLYGFGLLNALEYLDQIHHPYQGLNRIVVTTTVFLLIPEVS